MDYQDYTLQAQQVASSVESENYKEALSLLQVLLDSDLSDLDKSMMCVNVAVVYDKLQQSAESLRWYDEGIAYEVRHSHFFVEERKAEYLFYLGREEESVEIYEELLTRDYLMESDKERIRHNVKIIRGEIE